MRIYLPCILLIAFSSHTSFSQQGLYQFSKSYFRSDPFTGEFSSFLKHLINDPSMNNKEIHQRTDSSLFYFAGTYTNYNPFFFKPSRVQLILKEAIIDYADSIPKDTVFVYQLLAYTDSTKSGEKEVKKEFSKIHRQFDKKFFNSNYKELKNGSIITGAVHNYFVSFAGLAPATVAWDQMEGNNEYALIVMLRFKTSGNETVLAAPFYQSQ